MKRSILKTSLFLFLLTGALLVETGTAAAQNFPPFYVTVSDSSATQGYYFMIPYTNTPPIVYSHPLMILDRLGRLIFYRTFPFSVNANPAIDFKLQKNGMMSYFNLNKVEHRLMDSTFTEVDSIECTGGFETDQHELQVTADNHYFVIGRETRVMNLSSYHWFGITHTQPGSANAEVIGVVIQEFDENRNLVWEWKSHDHYSFGDVNPVWLFSPTKVDWTHANALDVDQDGNIMLSLRHFDEITKIDHTTGNIIWRLGGRANQFTFLNDTIGFTGQHDIRRATSNTITIFDNGQYTHPAVARGLEYQLDEVNKMALLVWDYIYDSAMYSVACGSHTRLPDGNHLIDYGFNLTGYPFLVQVKPDGSPIMQFDGLPGYTSYRTFNYFTLPWQLQRPAVDCQKIGTSYHLVAEPGHPSYRWSTGEITQSIEVTDTGTYWVFVPFGTGFMCSEYIRVTDPAHPCIPAAIPGIPPSAEPGLLCTPNPTTGRTRVFFDLQEDGNARLTLRTVLGTVIAVPADGHFTKGRHDLTLDLSSRAPGIYLLSLETREGQVTERIVMR